MVESFCQRLKRIRIDRGKNITDVANYLCLRVDSYRRYESGIRKPDVEVLIRLADYFGCTVDYLVRCDLDNDLIDRDLVVSYKDLKDKGLSDKLSHGLIKGVIDEKGYQALQKISPDDKVKYVLKTDLMKYLKEIVGLLGD